MEPNNCNSVVNQITCSHLTKIFSEVDGSMAEKLDLSKLSIKRSFFFLCPTYDRPSKLKGQNGLCSKDRHSKTPGSLVFPKSFIKFLWKYKTKSMELPDDSNNCNMNNNSNRLPKYEINTETTAAIGILR